MDPYKILGIDANASDDEVKKAYRKLAKRYHPDVCKEANAEAKFKEVQNAYDMIMDLRKNKKAYSYQEQTGGYDQKYAYIINYINMGYYMEAYLALEQIQDKDALWYYLYAIVNIQMGNRLKAMQASEQACNMDPTNAQYRELYAALHRSYNQYTHTQSIYQTNCSSLCCSCLAFNLCCGSCFPCFCCC